MERVCRALAGSLRVPALLAFVVGVAAAGPAFADAAKGEPRSLYEIRPVADAVAIGVAGLVSAVPYLLLDELVDPSCPCDPKDVRWFDETALGNDDQLVNQLSNVTVGLSLVAPLALDALALDNRRLWLEDAVVFTETVMVTTALTTATKFLVQRPEPRVYRPGRPAFVARPRSYLSFFSGHTAVTFATLGATTFTVGLRYGIWAAPTWITFGLGSSMAALMVLSGRHFPSDVFVGAIVGSAVGVVVPWLHLRTRTLRLWPAPLPGGGAGLGLSGRF